MAVDSLGERAIGGRRVDQTMVADPSTRASGLLVRHLVRRLGRVRRSIVKVARRARIAGRVMPANHGRRPGHPHLSRNRPLPTGSSNQGHRLIDRLDRLGRRLGMSDARDPGGRSMTGRDVIAVRVMVLAPVPVRIPARGAMVMPTGGEIHAKTRATTPVERAAVNQRRINDNEEDEARRMGQGQTPITAENREMPDHLVVAIDGPAASGKTTVGSAVAARIGGLFFDTGVVYRALTLAAIHHQVESNAALRLAGLARRMQVDVRPPSRQDGRLYDVWLEGKDVTWAIRDAAVDRAVSEVSSHPAVRKELLGLQRRIAHSGRVVMVGRDIGTVIVPKADVKIWLDAGLEERARRRQHELAERGVTRSIDELARELAERDAGDASKEMGAMVRADDALTIDTTGSSIEDVVSTVVAIVQNRDHGVGNA